MAITFGQSNQFSRTVHTTVANFIKKQEPNILRKRRRTAMLQEKGRIVYNKSGDELKWPVKYKRSPLNVIGDVVNIKPARRNKKKNARLPWAGYEVDDAQERLEKLSDRGKEAIIRTVNEIVPDLMDDIKDHFALELYKDGSGVGNAGRIFGNESWSSYSGTANNKAGTPNDSYAGHSTAPGVLGTWTGSWPDGDGDAEYEWWSPIVGLAQGTGWAASTKTWANTAKEVLRYVIFSSERTTVPLDYICLTRVAYQQFVELLESNERILTERSGSNSLLVKLGFGSVVNFENVDITWEQGVDSAASTALGYGETCDHVELCSMNSQLFIPEPMDFSLEDLTDRYVVTFYGQFRANPRFNPKIVDAAS